MKKLTSLTSFALIACFPMVVLADSMSLTGSIRIGLAYEDSETNSSDFSINNFASRLILQGDRKLDHGLTGVGYIELGLDADDNEEGNSGADQTRQLWAGVSADWGSVKIGSQYAAFYDLISVNTDIAWWGSCWTQLECGRDTRVLKYNGAAGPVSYAASYSARTDSEEQERGLKDELELGINYSLGNLVLGLAGSIQSDAGENNGGQLFGVMLAGEIGPVGLAFTYQLADEDFAAAEDDVSNTTVAATLGEAYFVYNLSDDGDQNPQYATLGYALNLDAASLVYFEAQIIDDDTAADTDNRLRAVYKFDF